jgi:Bacterial protein of unknown function (DUF853).
MSRMDILSESEIAQVLAKSALKKKYNQEIDRESAYEILNAKIANAAEHTAKEPAPKKTTSTTAKTTAPQTTTTKRSTAQNPIVKLLTSATFVRGVFGVLSKLMKK